MILLAATGIGLAGGVPLPTLRRREDNPVSIELFELDKVNEQANLDEAEEKT
ncbi:hypothetical protein Phep_0673 [Pedobacter heparinus DSM 2366]|uniref:Uncharacterized protein n=2 Tax=Pedobacter heparinus TaxID=984 RepID=C6Y1B9_PEDHD|nr:hypothetical protein Phep_0673 [Pedobacter heparinus DSM 2366]